MKLSEESFKSKVAVTVDVALDAIFKLIRFGIVKFLRLVCIDPYLFFLILKTPNWLMNYVEQFTAYRALLLAAADFLKKQNFNEMQIEKSISVPLVLLELAKVVPDFSHAQVEGVIKKYVHEANKRMSYGKEEVEEEIILAMVLDKFLAEGKEDIALSGMDKFLAEGKIDAEFWSKAFKHCSDMKVVAKFFKNKDRQPIQNDAQLPEGRSSMIPKDSFLEELVFVPQAELPEEWSSGFPKSLFLISERLRGG